MHWRDVEKQGLSKPQPQGSIHIMDCKRALQLTYQFRGYYLKGGHHGQLGCWQLIHPQCKRDLAGCEEVISPRIVMLEMQQRRPCACHTMSCGLPTPMIAQLNNHLAQKWPDSAFESIDTNEAIMDTQRWSKGHRERQRRDLNAATLE